MTATEEPTTDDEIQWRRRFAAVANNLAWSLVELEARTPEQTDTMIDSAHASAFLWSAIGTDLHGARSRMLLAIAHGLAGHGALALPHATACLDYFSQHECPDWEIAFAHAAMACAAAAADDASAHARNYEEARRLGDAIADAEDRAVFMKTFERIPAPGPRP
jgi:hypothetical protein